MIKEGKLEEKEDSFYAYSDEDLDDYDDNQDESFEEEVLDKATASETIPEYEAEIKILVGLEKEALALRNSEKDSKWDALRNLLDGTKEMFDSKGHRRKLIIFTEHRDTLTYLEARIRRLIGKPEAVVTIHGGVKREHRKEIQNRFTQDKSVCILLATDAAGEGINLQRANLMINYDLPWNPNRIEQRFGRIHRIGQIEVCFLWSLIAQDTREGDVFMTLFEKLEEQRKALDGRVFDVLGKVFREQSLKDLLLDAIKYGDDPQRKLDLQQQVKGVLDLEHIREVLKQHAVGETSLSKTDIQAIREELERANARKLQPHFIAAFFRSAFTKLGGNISEREKGRFEIRYVPASIRQNDPINARKILKSYERICFDKEIINVEGKPTAEFMCPGNPLFDSVVDITLTNNLPLLKQGSILVDTSGRLNEPALLYYLIHEVEDEMTTSEGVPEVVSRQMDFVYLTKSGKIVDAGCAPYLDCRVPTKGELSEDLIDDEWINNSPEKKVIDYAATTVVMDEFKKVELRRKEHIDKTIKAVKERLTKEIVFWDRRAEELKEKELSGKERVGLNSGKARQMADELESRMNKRLDELGKQKKLKPKQPFIIGGALVLPESYVGKKAADFAKDAESRKKIEMLAMNKVTEAEKQLGRKPFDVSAKKYGWDIESHDLKTKDIFFIEVKGRVVDADVITVHKNEILAGKNVAEDNPERYILAIVQIEKEKAKEPKYIRNPFDKVEVPFEVTSMNFDIDKLLKKAEDPR